MATILETELEQKTSEYAFYVKEYFKHTGNEFYCSETLDVGFEDGELVMQYRGK